MDLVKSKMNDGNISKGELDYQSDYNYYNFNDTYYYYWPGGETSQGFFNFAKYLTVYFQPFLFGFGLVGNLLSFVIFLSKPLRKISSNIYLAGKF